MTKYTVEWCESKTSSKGTEYKRCTLKDEAGTMMENVAVFKTFDKYDAVLPGATVEGLLRNKPFNGKPSYNLDNMTASAGSNPPMSRGGAMTRAMDRKEKVITQTMDRKEEGIKLSSTFRDATAITAALAAKHDAPTREWFESEWKRWRSWLWNHYDEVDVTETVPFD